jgi:hypothetical protein
MPDAKRRTKPLFGLGLALTILVLIAGIVVVTVSHGREPWMVMLGVVLSFLDAHYLRLRLGQRRDADATGPVLISLDVVVIAAAVVAALLVWAQGTLWSLLFLVPIIFYARRVRQQPSGSRELEGGGYDGLAEADAAVVRRDTRVREDAETGALQGSGQAIGEQDVLEHAAR